VEIWPECWAWVRNVQRCKDVIKITFEENKETVYKFVMNSFLVTLKDFSLNTGFDN